MRAHGGALLAYAFTLTGTSASATVLVEDALTRVFARGRPPDDVEGARSEVVRQIRRAAVRRRGADDAALVDLAAVDPLDPDDEDEDDPDDAALTQAALRTLPSRGRACVVMRYADGLAVDAIAAETGLGVEAVRAALADAVERLLDLRPGLGIDLTDALEGGAAETVSVSGR